MSRWLMNALVEAATPNGYRAVVTTDASCHLWLRWSRNKPQRHPRAKVVRGLRLMGDVYYCFTAYNDIEQEEAGDTLEHTFIMSDWPACETRWFYLWGTIGGEVSPSESPIWGRHLSFSTDSFRLSVTNPNDEINHHGGATYECSWFCPIIYNVGRWQTAARKEGGAFRFASLPLPQYAEVTQANLHLTAYETNAATVVNCRISAEGDSSPPNFLNVDWSALLTRWNTRIGITDWNNLSPWVKDSIYSSPDIKTPLTLLVARSDWENGNPAVLFWEDFDQRTAWHASRNRWAYTYNTSPAKAPFITVTYKKWQLEGVNP